MPLFNPIGAKMPEVLPLLILIFSINISEKGKWWFSAGMILSLRRRLITFNCHKCREGGYYWLCWVEVGILLNILECTEQPPKTRIIWSVVSVVLKLRKLIEIKTFLTTVFMNEEWPFYKNYLCNSNCTNKDLLYNICLP